MGTIIWCARIRHDVEDSRSDVERAITHVKRQRDPRSLDVWVDADGEERQSAPLAEPPGFIFVTPMGAPTQRLLNVDLISSIEAIPGSGI